MTQTEPYLQGMSNDELEARITYCQGLFDSETEDGPHDDEWEKEGIEPPRLYWKRQLRASVRELFRRQEAKKRA